MTQSKPTNQTLWVGFYAMGDPVYSDVGTVSGPFATYDEAVESGMEILKVRNWRSFFIEKRWCETHETIPRD